MSARVAFERWLLGLLSPGGRRARLLVLTYHRVLPAPDPLLPGEPDIAALIHQMQALAGLCHVLPLPEAAERLARGDLPPRTACITFDDGYRNNLECAVPVLRDLGLTATFFVTQNAVQCGIMWNDLVIEAVRRAPDRVDLSWSGLNETECGAAADRPDLISKLLNALKYRPLEERWRLARGFFEACTGDPPPRLMLTEADVSAMASAGFDMGGHTVSHPILMKLPPAEARQEIEEGAAWLAGLTGRQPVSFAYPNGRPGQDFDSTHEAMVREAGFRLAVSTVWGCATVTTDRFSLPRLSLPESNQPGIARRLGKIYLRSYTS